MQLPVGHQAPQLLAAVLPLIEAEAPVLLLLHGPIPPLCLAQLQAGTRQPPMLLLRVLVASTDAAEFLVAAFPKTFNAAHVFNQGRLWRQWLGSSKRNNCHEVRRSGLGDCAPLCAARSRG
jgi:hypothetical protein